MGTPGTPFFLAFILHSTDLRSVPTIHLYPWTVEALKLKQRLLSRSPNVQPAQPAHTALFPHHCESQILQVTSFNPDAIWYQTYRKHYRLVWKGSIITSFTRTLTSWVREVSASSLVVPFEEWESDLSDPCKVFIGQLYAQTTVQTALAVEPHPVSGRIAHYHLRE